MGQSVKCTGCRACPVGSWATPHRRKSPGEDFYVPKRKNFLPELAKLKHAFSKKPDSWASQEPLPPSALAKFDRDLCFLLGLCSRGLQAARPLPEPPPAEWDSRHTTHPTDRVCKSMQKGTHQPPKLPGGVESVRFSCQLFSNS